MCVYMYVCIYIYICVYIYIYIHIYIYIYQGFAPAAGPFGLLNECLEDFGTVSGCSGDSLIVSGGFGMVYEGYWMHWDSFGWFLNVSEAMWRSIGGQSGALKAPEVRILTMSEAICSILGSTLKMSEAICSILGSTLRMSEAICSILGAPRPDPRDCRQI